MWNYDDSTPIGSISGRGFALFARNKTHQDCVQKNQKLLQIFLFTFKHKFPETGALLNLSEAFSFIFFFEHKYIGHIYIRRKCEKVQKREEKNPLFFPCYAFARKQEIQDLFYPVLRAKPKGTNHGSYV